MLLWLVVVVNAWPVVVDAVAVGVVGVVETVKRSRLVKKALPRASKVYEAFNENKNASNNSSNMNNNSKNNNNNNSNDNST